MGGFYFLSAPDTKFLELGFMVEDRRLKKEASGRR